eukprot:GHVT01065629.1.p1 GENE.GHVT01065629.1~~GHVT01065629.1.p1  ORF type:complete len:136 (+),score=19.63 GHVT01065629.1:3-410(+)
MDIPTDSDEEPGTPEVLSDIAEEDEEDIQKSTAADRLLADWRGKSFVEDDDDMPSSASSDELFSDEVNAMESDTEVDTSRDEAEMTPEKNVADTRDTVGSTNALRDLARELVFGDHNIIQDTTEVAEKTVDTSVT